MSQDTPDTTSTSDVPGIGVETTRGSASSASPPWQAMSLDERKAWEDAQARRVAETRARLEGYSIAELLVLIEDGLDWGSGDFGALEELRRRLR